MLTISEDIKHTLYKFNLPYFKNPNAKENEKSPTKDQKENHHAKKEEHSIKKKKRN